MIAEVLRQFQQHTNGWVMRQFLVWCHRNDNRRKDIIRRGELFWAEKQTNLITKSTMPTEYYDAAGRPVDLSAMQEAAIRAAITAAMISP